MSKQTNLTFKNNKNEIDQHYQDAGEDFVQRFATKPYLLDALRLEIFSQQIRGVNMSDICKKLIWH